MSKIQTERGPIDQSYWVIPGSLLVGPHPGASSDQETLDRINKICKLGIKSFVDLTASGERTSRGHNVRPYNSLIETDIKYQNFPVEDQCVPSDEQLLNILSQIDSDIASGNPVYLHCRGGKFRTGMIVSCFLISHDLADAENALEMEQKLRNHYSLDNSSLLPRQVEKVYEFAAWDIFNDYSFRHSTRRPV